MTNMNLLEGQRNTSELTILPKTHLELNMNFVEFVCDQNAIHGP